MIGTIAWFVLGLAIVLKSTISEAQFAGRPSELEPDEASLSLAPPYSRPSRARYVAKPGSVIVHFDRNHDIQQLQYVMQDGRLANLYQRHPNHPANTQTPTPIRVDGSQVRAASKSLPVIDQDETIEVVDDKKRAKLMLVGNHMTIPLPNHELEGTSPSQKGHNHHKDLESDADSTDSSELEDEKLDVLATVAVDAMQAGTVIADMKLKKAAVMLSKLKDKVSAKLHELPGIVESNLRAKSTLGKMFVDESGHKVKLVADDLDESESSNRPSSASQQQLVVARHAQIPTIKAQRDQHSIMIGRRLAFKQA